MRESGAQTKSFLSWREISLRGSVLAEVEPSGGSSGEERCFCFLSICLIKFSCLQDFVRKR